MNKKGFTLVELIAAIAILGILMVIAGPAVFKIREMVLINSLDSKLSLVKSAAIEFGSTYVMEVPSIKSEWIDIDNDGTKDSGETFTPVQMNACNQACMLGQGTYSGTPGDCPIAESKFDCRNHCKVVSVKALIQRGYVAGDGEDKEILLNPISSKSLNETEICITFDSEKALDRKLIAYIFEEDKLYE